MAIIGLLASIVLVSLNSVRAKARNVRRVADMKQIQTALELFYDTNGNYPNLGWAWRSECVGYGGFAANDVILGLVPTYLAKFPSDPSMNKSANLSCYLYISNGTDYAFLDHNGPDIDYASRSELQDPTRDSGSNACIIDGSGFWSWKVSSPGGRCW